MQQPPAQQIAQPTNTTGFNCRPVTSREEAVAVLSDYFTQGTVMPDLGHGRIYLKRFNPNTGASDFFEFALVQQEPESPAQNSPDKLQEYLHRIEASCARVEELVGRLGQRGEVKESVIDES